MFRRMTSSEANKKKSEDVPPAEYVEEKEACEYTLPGVLHFIEHKMKSFEEEKSQWKVEEAELKSHIAVLKGQIKGNGFVTLNLMRRIMMLEFCLKQERKENLLLRNKTEDPNVIYEEEDIDTEDTKKMTIFASEFDKQREANHMVLETYMKEVEEIEKSINAFCTNPEWMFSLRSCVRPANEELEQKPPSGDDGQKAESSSSCSEVLDNSFSFLYRDRGAKKTLLDRINEYKDHRAKAMSKYKKKEEAPFSDPEPEEVVESPKEGENVEEFNPDAEVIANHVAAIERIFEEKDVPLLVFNAKKSLKSHLDCVRSVVFHPLDPILYTASEDGTIKQWFIAEHQPDNVVPVCTLRGHNGAVISLAIDVEGQVLCSGGADGYMCYWNPPAYAEFKDIRYNGESIHDDPYEQFSNRSMLSARVLAHNNIIWSIAIVRDRVISASADGLVKIWCPNEEVLDILPPENSGNPVAVEVLQDAEGQAVVAYQNSCVVVISYMTAKILRQFCFGFDIGCTVTAIVSHPSSHITCVACTDHKIRFFQNESGAHLTTIVAHSDAVSCLAMDTDGHILLSGSHDGNIRMWDFERRLCLQEIKAHRTKGDQGVLSIAFHNNYQMFGSGGADNLAKILLP